MPDSRFESLFSNTTELLGLLDVDDLDDVGTLFMFLFDRPAEVVEVQADDANEPSLEVLIHGRDYSQGTILDFPASVLDLARAGAESADELGPYDSSDDGDRDEEAPLLSALSDDELVAELRSALGGVRVFNAIEGRD